MANKPRRANALPHAMSAPIHPSCVLIGWELGAGLGHVGMLRPLATALRKQGHRVVLALRETEQTRHLLRNDDLEILQAPVAAPVAVSTPLELRTLADVLYGCGFADTATVHDQVVAWREILREVNPRLVVAEYSPSLAIAAYGTRPFVTVGSGFSVPPPICPAPPFRYWESETPAQSAIHDTLVQQATNAVRRALGLPELAHWTQLFSGDFVGVCTYPALDNYRSYRKHQAIGPLQDPGAKPLTSNRQRRGVFAYLSGFAPDFDTIVAGIALASCDCQAFVRDLQPGQRESIAASGIRLHETPLDLRSELCGFAAIVHHGGLSTTHVALETATPQLVFPTITEQVLTAQRLVDLRVGLGLSRQQRSQDSIAGSLRNVVDNPTFLAQASKLADVAHQRQGPSALSALVARCNDLISAKAQAGRLGQLVR